MNLKEFLRNKTDVLAVTEEVLFPVMVCAGTFSPFHVGYLPMLTKMVKESEQFRAEPIVVIVDSPLVEYATKKLKQIMPGVKVMVRKTLADALSDLSRFQRAPVKILTETSLATSAKMLCETMYPFSAIDIDTSAYVTNIEATVKQSLLENDFLKFQTSHIDCPLIEARQQFTALRG